MGADTPTDCTPEPTPLSPSESCGGTLHGELAPNKQRVRCTVARTDDAVAVPSAFSYGCVAPSLPNGWSGFYSDQLRPVCGHRNGKATLGPAQIPALPEVPHRGAPGQAERLQIERQLIRALRQVEEANRETPVRERTRPDGDCGDAAARRPSAGPAPRACEPPASRAGPD